MSNPLEEVRQEAWRAVDVVTEAINRLDWMDPKVYACWLRQTYGYVDHATRLLAFAMARTPLEHEELHWKFFEGINEERDHEGMAQRDLEELGYKLEDFPELPGTSAYFQTLYYMIDVDGPETLLGYFMALEGMAAEKMDDIYNQLVERFGIKACSFLEEHCLLDKTHFREGLEYLATLTEGQLKNVKKALAVSARHYVNLIEDIETHCSTVQRERHQQVDHQVSAH